VDPWTRFAKIIPEHFLLTSSEVNDLLLKEFPLGIFGTGANNIQAPPKKPGDATSTLILGLYLFVIGMELGWRESKGAYRDEDFDEHGRTIRDARMPDGSIPGAAPRKLYWPVALEIIQEGLRMGTARQVDPAIQSWAQSACYDIQASLKTP